MEAAEQLADARALLAPTDVGGTPAAAQRKPEAQAPPGNPKSAMGILSDLPPGGMP